MRVSGLVARRVTLALRLGWRLELRCWGSCQLPGVMLPAGVEAAGEEQMGSLLTEGEVVGVEEQMENRLMEGGVAEEGEEQTGTK